MKNIIILTISLLIAFITWKIHGSISDWKFFVAFIGGGIDVYLLTMINNKK